MNKNNRRRLIQQSLGNGLSHEEREMLARHIAEDPAMADESAIDARLSQALSAMPMVEPPTSLRENILAEIRVKKTHRINQHGWLATAIRSLRITPEHRFSYGFAAGLAIGLILLVGVAYWKPASFTLNPSAVSGAMMRIHDQPFQALDKTELRTTGAEAVIQVWRSQNLILIGANIISDNPVTVKVTYQSDDVHIEGIKYPEQYAGTQVMAEDLVQLQVANGGQFELIFSDHSDRVTQVRYELITDSGGTATEISTGSDK